MKQSTIMYFIISILALSIGIILHSNQANYIEIASFTVLLVLLGFKLDEYK